MIIDLTNKSIGSMARISVQSCHNVILDEVNSVLVCREHARA